MQWAIINGSPRGQHGNTAVLTQAIINSAGIPSENITLLYAAQIHQRQEIVERMTAADGILIAFPLYTDTISGQLQALFEVMEENKQRLTGKPAWFVVHSGFPETSQAKTVESLLSSSICPAIGLSYMGTIRAGIAYMYINALSNIKSSRGKSIHKLLQDMAQGKPFDKETLDKATGFNTLPGLARLAMQLVPVNNFMYSQLLWRNKAFKQRMDRPYA